MSEEKFVEIRGRAVRYVESGDGPPLVLLHSLLVYNSLRQWEPHFAALGKQRHVYALDMPGWGKSEMPDEVSFAVWADTVRDFVEKLNIGQTDVMGFSLGAWIGLVFAHRNPQLVRRLALLEMPGLNPRPPQMADQFALPSRELVARFNAGLDIDLIYEEMDQPGREESYRTILRYVSDPANREEWSPRPRLPEMTMPILFGNVDNHRTMPVENMYEAFTLAPHSHLLILPAGPGMYDLDSLVEPGLRFLTAEEVVPARGPAGH